MRIIMFFIAMLLLVSSAFAFTYARSYDDGIYSNSYVIVPDYDYAGPLYGLHNVQDEFIYLDFGNHHRFIPSDLFW